MHLFNTISLEIASICNRKCKFCPVAYNTRPDERMNFETLTKIIEELRALNYAGRVELYIYNEPTRDMPYLLDTIAAVRQWVPRACIMVATNGDYMRGPQHITPMFDAGLNQLLINCYAPRLYERRLPWLEGLPADIERDGPLYSYISPRRKVVALQDKGTPEVFGKGVFSLINRAGNIPGFLPAAPEPLKRMCVKPFRLLNINWQGEAMVCCQDYHGDVKVGNAADHTVEQLWNSPVLNTYRKYLLAKDRSLPLCAKCDCHSGAYPANVEAPTGSYASKRSIEEQYSLRKT